MSRDPWAHINPQTIVAALREMDEPSSYSGDAAVGRVAADEIERLRAEVARLRAALQEAMTMLREARDFPSDLYGPIDEKIERFVSAHNSKGGL